MDCAPNDPKSPSHAQIHLNSCTVRYFICTKTGLYPGYQGVEWATLLSATVEPISTKTGSCPSYQEAKWPELPRVVEDLISIKTQLYPDTHEAKWAEPPKKVNTNHYKYGGEERRNGEKVILKLYQTLTL